MTSGVYDLILALLNPRNLPDYAVKLIFLCGLTTAVSIVTERAIGADQSYPVSSHVLVTFVVAAPFFTLVMLLTRKLVDLQNELAKLASTDMLTGLANRRAFFSLVSDAGRGAMLMIDVDHFKTINDTYGHAVGDDVLNLIAAHLRRSVRDGDVVARIGGEEFAVFLDGADARQAAGIGARICEGVSYCPSDAGPAVNVTLSVGVAVGEDDDRGASLVDRADRALYAAKRAGRGCVMWWTRMGTVSRVSHIA